MASEASGAYRTFERLNGNCEVLVRVQLLLLAR
jgi:hypothetical protein